MWTCDVVGTECSQLKFQIVLFDDDQNNVKIAGAKGMRPFYCKASSSKEIEKGKETGFNREVWKDFVKKKGGSAGGCVIM